MGRLKGTVPPLKVAQPLELESSFVTDCGAPSIYERPLECVDCTMCCNSLDDCYPTAPAGIQKAGFANYKSFSRVLFIVIIGVCVVLHFTSVIFQEIKDKTVAQAFSDVGASAAVTKRDKRYALDKIGSNSVFSFFLTRKWWGWAIALITMA